MLDKFLAVAYSGEQKKTASRQLVDKLKTYPIEELKKLASGDSNCKLAYADACGPSRDDTWLGKYKGTPLFAKAVELEKSLVQLDMEDQQMRAQERAVRPDPSDTWMKRDAINLQKRMLDLDLVMAENGGDPTEAAPAEAMPAEAGGAPPPPAPPKEKAVPEAPAEAGGEGGEPSEEEVLQALEAEAGGAGGEGAPPPPQQQPQKPKAPPQQAQGGEEESEEEEGQPPKKDDKPKGMSVEVKQAAPNAHEIHGLMDSLGSQGSRALADAAKKIAPRVPAWKKPAATHAATALAAGAAGAGIARALPKEKQSSAKTAAAAAVGAGALFAKLASSDTKVRREVAKKFPQLAKEKTASDPAGHHVRRALLGNPMSSAIEARPGERLNAYGDAYGHQLAEGLKGGLKGGLLGAGAGALGGAGLALMNRNPAHLGSMLVPGAAIGGGLGLMAGAIKGTHGEEASRIHAARSKHNAPEEKVANLLGALGGAASAAKGLATTAHAAGGLPQVAKSFGSVAKNFAQKNPLTAAGIAGAGGLMAGKALSPSQSRQ